jgi:hypothetical protein
MDDTSIVNKKMDKSSISWGRPFAGRRESPLPPICAAHEKARRVAGRESRGGVTAGWIRLRV